MAIGRAAIRRFRKANAKAMAAGIMAHANEDLDRLDEEIGKVANDAAEGIKDGIKRQSFNHEPVSDEHAAWKRRTGKDHRTLIADGKYVEAITAIRDTRLRYIIGVKNETHKSSGLRMGLLAKYLEHGTLDGIPPRPHFKPARLFARVVLEQVLHDFSKKQKQALRTVKEPRA